MITSGKLDEVRAEQLRKEYNAAVANGLLLRARHVDRLLKSLERSSKETASRQLYEAELALHDAHQSHVDEWITAASDHLHRAATDYSEAIRMAVSAVLDYQKAGEADE
jgi:hypothetical protein